MRNLATTEPAASPTPTETRSYRLDSTAPLMRPPHDPYDERRDRLERDLDRVQQSLNSERTSFGQQLNWLMLSQALLLNAFLAVLILGWSTPLPAKRWLLVGVAVFACVVAVLIVLSLRGTRDAIMSLHQQRKFLEAALQRDFGRAPVFVPRGVVTRHLAGLANGVLPLTFVAGWIALAIYTLAAPLATDAGAAPAALRPQSALPAPAQPVTVAQSRAGAERTPPQAASAGGGFNW